MKLSKLIMTGLVFSFSSLIAESDIQLDMNHSIWSPFLLGQMRVDFEQTPNFNQQDDSIDYNSTYLNLSYEHSNSVLPNVGLQTNIKEHKRKANINQLVVFDSTAYSGGQLMDSQVDLTHRDHLLYYNIISSDIDLDLGMDIIRFDGRIVMKSQGVHRTVDFKKALPGLYGKLRYDLPETSLYFEATGSYVLNNNDTFHKSRLVLGWESESGVGIEVGYQSYAAEWHGYEDTSGNISFEGLYTGLRFNF